ncbi:MAG: phosphotransferase [Akkermansiaceae bacterium]|nr:phosphotransferase [Akkermansiaceae bacterium]
MSNEVPSFDHDQLAAIAIDLYGIEGEISSLDSYEDQNARIKTPMGSYVLKIANKRWSHEELNLQTRVLDHLNKSAPEVHSPLTLANKEGETMAEVDGFSVRMLTFLEGKILGKAARSPELNLDIGRFMGKFTKAMESFEHLVPESSNDLWNLDNVLACKMHLGDIIGEEDRSRIEGFYDRYESNTLPRVGDLRKTIIHNDANEQNLLVAHDNPSRLAGLIDFGDLQRSSHINELAITLAYALLGQDDFESTARQIVKGYAGVISLEEFEREVLFDLMAMRLVQSVTLSSHRAKEFPENKYIVSSQQPARELLKKLESHHWD